jgi:hypothetical protein
MHIKRSPKAKNLAVNPSQSPDWQQKGVALNQSFHGQSTRSWWILRCALDSAIANSN